MSYRPLPIYVVSAPSGTGKTTLNRRLVEEHPEIEIAVSLTTRLPRKGEEHGVHYYFVSPAEFQSRIHMGEMLENANVHGNFYGTSLVELGKVAQRGHIPLLEIDVQGWDQAKGKLPNAVSVFILPPSMQVLWERLEKRGTDSIEVRMRRLRNARAEIAAAGSYRWFVLNDDLERAYQELKSIIVHGQPGRLGAEAGTEICQRLVQEFDQASWVRDIEQQVAAGNKGS